MYRRLVVPLITLAAVLGLFAVLLPTGATGAERSSGSDSYYVNETASIDAPVNGTVQVYGGNVQVREVIAGDLLVLGGSVVFSGRGRVNGNLIHAGSTIRGEDGRIGGRVYPLTSLEGAAASLTKNAIVASPARQHR